MMFAEVQGIPNLPLHVGLNGEPGGNRILILNSLDSIYTLDLLFITPLHVYTAMVFSSISVLEILRLVGPKLGSYISNRIYIQLLQ